MRDAQRSRQPIPVEEIHPCSGPPRPDRIDGQSRRGRRQCCHGELLRPGTEKRSRPPPVGEPGTVENRDRDVDRADISPPSPTSSVGSIDTCRVRSNHRASCSRSMTLTLSPFFASVPFAVLLKRVAAAEIERNVALDELEDANSELRRRLAA